MVSTHAHITPFEHHYEIADDEGLLAVLRKPLQDNPDRSISLANVSGPNPLVYERSSSEWGCESDRALAQLSRITFPLSSGARVPLTLPSLPTLRRIVDALWLNEGAPVSQELYADLFGDRSAFYGRGFRLATSMRPLDSYCHRLRFSRTLPLPPSYDADREALGVLEQIEKNSPYSFIVNHGRADELHSLTCVFPRNPFQIPNNASIRMIYDSYSPAEVAAAFFSSPDAEAVDARFTKVLGQPPSLDIIEHRSLEEAFAMRSSFTPCNGHSYFNISSVYVGFKRCRVGVRAVAYGTPRK